MTIISALVLLAVIWFMVLLIALPLGIRTQAEAGSVVPGTPESAPADPMIRRKLIWTTAIAVPLWAAVCAVIIWGGITVRDIDILGHMG